MLRLFLSPEAFRRWLETSKQDKARCEIYIQAPQNAQRDGGAPLVPVSATYSRFFSRL